MGDAVSLLKPNPDYRPNPARAVYVQGVINQQLIDRLTPRIVELQSQSRDPIAVYIDSPGGATTSVEALLRLLSASNQDFSPACRLITVVTGTAASSAADLLSSGDYAIAYAEAAILYHGVRTSLDRPITVESASFLAESLKSGNDKYAMALANKSNSRFVFCYTLLRDKFDDFRSRSKAHGNLSDIGCFIGLLSELLSENARNILKQAEQRNARYDSLLNHISKLVNKSKRSAGTKRIADMESLVLRGIINFELSSNKDKSWTFREKGLAQLSDDFLLTFEFFTSYVSEQLTRLCGRWGDFFLTKGDLKELEQEPDNTREEKRIEKLKPIVRPIWILFVALCHALQEGENELTATDAFWLGLLDEVIGAKALPNLRLLVEFQRPHPEGNMNPPSTSV